MSTPLSRWHDFLRTLAAGRGGEVSPVATVQCIYCLGDRLVPHGPVELGPPPRRRYRCADCLGEMDLTMAKRDDA